MEIEKKHTKTINLRMEQELLEHVKRNAEKLDIDISTYIKWCIRTGLYLEDLNKFVRSRSKEL